jgi:spore germination protein GerM
MAEPTGHCPYLGLKQNRAIRFASPTPEHRCYVSGEPLEIPVDQTSYCLSQGHVHCPLYMGLTVPTTSDATPAIGGAAAAAAVPVTGVRGWDSMLSPRDRMVYALMLAMLALIVAIYLFVGLQSFLARNNAGDIGAVPTSAPSITQPATGQPAVGELPTTSAPTAAPPTPTDLPTNTPEPRPTDEPTAAPIILQPTSQPTSQPTQAATAAPTSTSAPTAMPTNTRAPSSAPAATATTRPPTPKPQPTAAPRPTAPPPVSTAVRGVTLYFLDSTGSVLVPVRRNTTVENGRIAEAAIRELIAGPRNRLGRLVSADTKLLGITIGDLLATVNFDRDPGGLDSIIFTLTEFPTVSQVQFQVNGANLGGPRRRPVLNPINPQNLQADVHATEFLPIYFPAASGPYDIRLIRMVPKTKQTAEGTIRALLEGPGPYANAVRRVIPENTELRGIKVDKGVVLVDFTQPFAEAGELDAAMRTVVESLTMLPGVNGVQFLVEGQAFADGRIFEKPAINQE